MSLSLFSHHVLHLISLKSLKLSWYQSIIASGTLFYTHSQALLPQISDYFSKISLFTHWIIAVLELFLMFLDCSWPSHLQITLFFSHFFLNLELFLMDNNSKMVVIPVTLKETNYLLWARLVKTALGGRGLWEVVEEGKTQRKRPC